MDTWFVYIIRCTNGALYTGSTNHVIRRWHEHISGDGAKYLRAYPPDELVYVEELENRSLACKREYEIKQFSKRKKEALLPSALTHQ